MAPIFRLLPYGYCYVDNEIKVVPKAEIVHTIYQLSINGKGSCIAKELNQQRSFTSK